MPQEIERKFLVKYIPDIKPGQTRHTLQGYLKTGADYEVRISNRLHLTTKSGFGLTREENIINISQEIFDALWPLTEGKRIEKIRKWIPICSRTLDSFTTYDFIAELDTYLGANTGLQTVEVEFNSENAANQFQPPDWFGADVTMEIKYKNSVLAK